MKKKFPYNIRKEISNKLKHGRYQLGFRLAHYKTVVKEVFLYRWHVNF